MKNVNKLLFYLFFLIISASSLSAQKNISVGIKSNFGYLYQGKTLGHTTFSNGFNLQINYKRIAFSTGLSLGKRAFYFKIGQSGFFGMGRAYLERTNISIEKFSAINADLKIFLYKLNRKHPFFFSIGLNEGIIRSSYTTTTITNTPIQNFNSSEIFRSTTQTKNFYNRPRMSLNLGIGLDYYIFDNYIFSGQIGWSKFLFFEYTKGNTEEYNTSGGRDNFFFELQFAYILPSKKRKK